MFNIFSLNNVVQFFKNIELSRKAEGTGPVKPWQTSIIKGAISCPNLLGEDNIANYQTSIGIFTLEVFLFNIP